MIDTWEEYKARLRGYIAKRVRAREDVDDILQNVFIKVHINLHTVKTHGSVAAWLFRIAANAIADHYRSQRPWEELSDEIAVPEAQRDYIVELANCVQPFIAELPDIYRLALTLSEIEGLPQKHLADRLGISLSGAKSRVQRGREKLLMRLLECCDIEAGRGTITGYELRKTNNCRCG
ncbi:MAG: RNA polymerase sigma factor SigZ [Rhodoferax sp.]|uniref:RNA polymerase sigma factor SigZ n=1 Tax=Rhodoferax sp. TaxID=50421 RepID=UPI00261CFFFB|nr:RNA polymerase sigma factor SigZ [Rhodoferax sp.]MDD5332809.1 RNA polymerase sigma factor SigZ [Rhodoferax sp.]